jgi:glutaredoxin
LSPQTLEIIVYFAAEDSALVALVSELDALDVEYDEHRLDDVSAETMDALQAAGGGSMRSPSVSINGEILAAPTAANVMSAIMRARSAGFYQ